MKTQVYQKKPVMSTKSTRPVTPYRVSLRHTSQIGAILRLQRTNSNHAMQQLSPSEDGITSKYTSTEIDRKGCKPGAVIVTYDKRGSGCNAKVKMNIAVHRCVTKCDDRTRLAEIYSFGQNACRDFCLKEKASSHYVLPNRNKCMSRTCDPTPGECPKECPIYNLCSSAPSIKQWNCKCNCGGIS